MIPREDIDQVRSAADLATLVRERGIELRTVGTRQVGLCPFHSERSGSFNVNAATNTFFCFGCGEKGDVFAFVMNMDGLPFVDAVRSLAERYSITLRETQQAGEEANSSLRKRAYDVLAESGQWMRANFARLPQEHPAVQELATRNLLEVAGQPTWLEDFGIGYTPEGWSHLSEHLSKKGFTEEEILAAGVATKSERSGRLVDRFRGRLMWEIRDIQGRVIGFGARKLFDSDDGPKYLNSPQSIVYDKSKVLYGLDLARKSIASTKEVHVVEGYTDVMAARAAGIENVVASSGTAFGEAHATIIRRLIDDYEGRRQGNFIFCFDSDEAGQKAARRTFAIKAPIHTRSYVAGSGMDSKDACDLRRDEGDESLRSFLSERVPLTNFVLNHELASHDISLAEGRASFLRVAASMLSVITDNMMRQDYARRIAFMSGSNYDAVMSAIASSSRYDPDEEPVATPDDDFEPAPEAEENMPFEPEVEQVRTPLWEQEKIVLALLVQHPHHALRAVEESGVTDQDFPDPVLKVMYLEATSLLSVPDVNITPHDFSNFDMAMEVFHQRLPVIEKMMGKDGIEDLIYRTASRFSRSLKEIPDRDKRRALQARVTAGYSDRATEDEGALQDILKAQRSLRRPRNKYQG